MRIAFTVILAAASLSVPALAFAQMGLDSDMNQDGTISQTEFMTRSNVQFSRIDTNGDGLLSADERETAHELFRAERDAKRFAAFDTNGDGVISREEFAAKDTGRRLPRGADDREHSGRAHRQMMGERGSKDGGPQKGGHWASVDADNDGFITRAEYDSRAQAMFKRMDRNGDGVIDKGDRPQRGERPRRGDR